jgi:hypothetical protein
MRKNVTYFSIESANIGCAFKKSKMQKIIFFRNAFRIEILCNFVDFYKSTLSII